MDRNEGMNKRFEGFQPINNEYTLDQFKKDNKLNKDCAHSGIGWGTVSPSRLTREQRYVELYALGHLEELSDDQLQRAQDIISQIGAELLKVFNDEDGLCRKFYEGMRQITQFEPIKTSLEHNEAENGYLECVWDAIGVMEALYPNIIGFNAEDGIQKGIRGPIAFYEQQGQNQHLQAQLNEALRQNNQWLEDYGQLQSNMNREANELLDANLAEYERMLNEALKQNSESRPLKNVLSAIQDKRKEVLQPDLQIGQKKNEQIEKIRNRNAQERIIIVPQDVQGLQQKLEETQQLLSQAHQALGSQRLNHNKLQSDLNTKHQQIISEWHARLQPLENSLKNQDGVIKGLENELKLSKQRVKDQSKEISDNQQQIKTLQNSLANQENQYALKVKNLTNQIQQLQNSVQQQPVNNPKTEQELREVKKQLADLQQAHKTELATLQEKLENLQLVNESLTKSAEKFETLEKSLQIQQKETSEKNQNIKELQSQIDSLNLREPVKSLKDAEEATKHFSKELADMEAFYKTKIEEDLETNHLQLSKEIAVYHDKLATQLGGLINQIQLLSVLPDQQNQLNSLKAEISKLQENLRGESKNKQQVEGIAQDLQSTTQELAQMLGASTVEVTQLRSYLEQLKVYIKQIEALNQTHQNTIKNLTEEHSKNHKEWENLVEKAKTLKEQKISAERLAETQKQKAEGLEQTVIQLQTNILQLEQVQNQTDNNNIEGQKLLNNQISELEKKLRTSQSDLEEQQEMNEGQKERITLLQNEQTLNQAQQKKLQKELKLKASEIENLALENGVLKQNKRDVEELQQRLTKAENEVQDKGIEAQKLTDQIKDLKSQIGNLGNQAEENEKLTTQLNQLQSTLKKEQSDLSKQEELVANLQTQQLDLEEKIKVLNEKLTSGEESKAGLEAKHSKLADEHQVLQQKLETTQDLLKQANSRFEEKNSAVNQLETEVKQLKEAAELGGKKNVELNAQLETLNKQLEEKQAAFDDQQNVVLGLNEQLKNMLLKLKTVLQTSEKEKTNLKLEIDQLKKELEEAKDTILGNQLDGPEDDSGEAVLELKSKIEELEERLTQSLEAANKLDLNLLEKDRVHQQWVKQASEERTILEGKIENLEELLETADSKLKKSELANKVRSNANEGVQPLVDNTGLSNRISDLQKKLAKAKKEAAQAKEGTEKLVEKAQIETCEERDLRQTAQKSLDSFKLKFKEQEDFIAKQAVTFKEFEESSAAKQGKLQKKLDNAKKLADTEKETADRLREENLKKDAEITMLKELLASKGISL